MRVKVQLYSVFNIDSIGGQRNAAAAQHPGKSPGKRGQTGSNLRGCGEEKITCLHRGAIPELSSLYQVAIPTELFQPLSSMSTKYSRRGCKHSTCHLAFQNKPVIIYTTCCNVRNSSPSSHSVFHIFHLIHKANSNYCPKQR